MLILATLIRSILVAIFASSPSYAAPLIATTAYEYGAFRTVLVPFGKLPALKRFKPSLEFMQSGQGVRCDVLGCHSSTNHENKVHRSSDPVEVLRQVNKAVNGFVTYQADSGQDSWAAPPETLEKRTGDCEDIAILKMAVLNSNGFKLDDMSLVIVKDITRNLHHAVLTVQHRNQTYVLDNVHDDVLLDSKVSAYEPLYSMSGSKGSLHGSKL